MSADPMDPEFEARVIAMCVAAKRYLKEPTNGIREGRMVELQNEIWRWHREQVERWGREVRTATVREIIADLRRVTDLRQDRVRHPRILSALANAFEGALDAELAATKGAPDAR